MAILCDLGRWPFPMRREVVVSLVVPCTGFEPVISALRGRRVVQLHQHGFMCQVIVGDS